MPKGIVKKWLLSVDYLNPLGKQVSYGTDIVFYGRKGHKLFPSYKYSVQNLDSKPTWRGYIWVLIPQSFGE
jgi:hypothetical protein